MITKDDLYDMAFVLITIRHDIHEKLNKKILSKVINVLKEKKNTEDNQIRKAISSIEGLNYENWFFVYHNNVYVNHQTLRNAGIYDLLLNLLQSLYQMLENEEFDKAYDLIDSFHCLPEIIADNHFTIPKFFWKTFVMPYRNKWDSNFLRVEQRNFKRYF